MDGDTWNAKYNAKIVRAIDKEFSNLTNPVQVMRCLNEQRLTHLFTDVERDKITMVADRKGDVACARELLSHLAGKQDWFRRLQKALRSDTLLCSHSADRLFALKEQVDSAIAREYSAIGHPSESLMNEVLDTWKNLEKLPDLVKTLQQSDQGTRNTLKSIVQELAILKEHKKETDSCLKDFKGYLTDNLDLKEKQKDLEKKVECLEDTLVSHLKETEKKMEEEEKKRTILEKKVVKLEESFILTKLETTKYIKDEEKIRQLLEKKVDNLEQKLVYITQEMGKCVKEGEGKRKVLEEKVVHLEEKLVWTKQEAEKRVKEEEGKRQIVAIKVDVLEEALMRTNNDTGKKLQEGENKTVDLTTKVGTLEGKVNILDTVVSTRVEFEAVIVPRDGLVRNGKVLDKTDTIGRDTDKIVRQNGRFVISLDGLYLLFLFMHQHGQGEISACVRKKGTDICTAPVMTQGTGRVGTGVDLLELSRGDVLEVTIYSVTGEPKLAQSVLQGFRLC